MRYEVTTHLLLLTLMRVMGIQGSFASVCLHVRTKMAETTITKHERDSPSRVLATNLILGQKLKVTGSQNAKTFQTIEWPA